MIDLNNQSNLDIDILPLETILNDLTSKDIELIFVRNNEMKKLNKKYRNINKATDVLSFPLEFDINIPLGSIVISVDFATQKAKEYNHSFEDEIKLLFIHGLLHLLGFNHETDGGEHRIKEQELIKKYNLPKSLIIRNC